VVHRLFHRRWKDARNETIWLTVYADLVTNLMLVFMVMFGLSLLGTDAFTKAVASMRPDAPILLTEKKIDFDAVAPALEREFKDQSAVRVVEELGAARLLLGDDVLFESGRAQLRPEARPVLREVAKRLAAMPFTIVVEGHTDNVPLKRSSPFRDNWELSLARAMSVLDVLKSDGGLAPERLASAAYGAYHPRAGNETLGGRRRNRRVEIALMRDFPTGGPVPAAGPPAHD
jgi:chemotaxis protein MotB